MGATRRDRASVLCVGQTTVDHVFTLVGGIDVGHKNVATSHTTRVGGVAATAAIAIARLGGSVRLLSRVGDDEAGAAVVAALDREGVDTTGLERVVGAATSVSSVVVAPDGARTVVNHTPEQMFRGPGSASNQGFDAVLVDGRWPDAAVEALRSARRNGVPGVVDVDRHLADPAHRRAIFDLASHLVFSEDALTLLAGRDDPVDGLHVAGDLTDAMVAVTCGARGVRWSDNGDAHSVDAFEVVAIDTNGAGDVFHGAFTLALAEGSEPDMAFRFASAAAALKCETGETPDRANVETLLARHDLVDVVP
jgi:sulfofructose kinase